MNRRHVLFTSAAAIAGAGYALNRFAGAQLIAPALAQAVESETGIVEMQLGNADAPVTVIEYASYTCPHCATFHNGSFKQLKADYIDTGKINFIYREVYFDAAGVWASVLARCGGPEKFFGISDLLYQDQTGWIQRDGSGQLDPQRTADALRKIGRLAGLENETIEACFSDEDRVRTMIGWYQANAEEHEIRSTPSFVINGQTYSNMNYPEFAELIDEALGA